MVNYTNMKAEKVVITHDEDGWKWEPRIETLPAIVRQNLDQGLNRKEKKIRNRVALKALLGLVTDAGWQICRIVYDDKRDERRYIYKVPVEDPWVRTDGLFVEGLK